ncbi:MAG: 23S rRNA (adenine(2503)-C(2))-methyltransferase RlmN [Bacteroidales bacterium]|nr:23S rRNA (adenine(2503)-C(2))-methyltransferase RlmN [Bacteroidales bacterium]
MKTINDLSIAEISDFLVANNEKSFRAKQIYQWIWQKNVTDFAAMTNLSAALRKILEANFSIRSIRIEQEYVSQDGTRKYILRLFDQQQIEMVLIPSQQRTTVCISSQVGCSLGCKFCATGSMGFKRNLHADEIYQQVFLANELSQQHYGTHLSNIVLMGMGEPLLNLDNVSKAIDMITGKDGMEMSPSRITLSTAGIPTKLSRLAALQPNIGLAVSLHAADPTKRKTIMPIANTYSIAELVAALKDYHKTTKQRITIEYLLLKNINDSLDDAQLLANLCKNFPVKINLINYNSHPHSAFQPTTKEQQEAFAELLESKNMLVYVRQSKGQDIAAACGQLVNKRQNGNK